MQAAYGRKIETLEAERILTSEKLAANGTKSAATKREAREKLETALTFLANPYKIWNFGDQTPRRTVLKLCFAERLKYCRNQGPRTPKITLPFRVLGEPRGADFSYGALQRSNLEHRF